MFKTTDKHDKYMFNYLVDVLAFTDNKYSIEAILRDLLTLEEQKKIILRLRIANLLDDGDGIGIYLLGC